VPEPSPSTSPTTFRVWIAGTIDAVWSEITRTDAPIAAFFNNRMDCRELAAGSRIAMRSPDGKWTGVVGEITEYDPPRRFAHTFRFTNMDDPECTVVYDLVEKDGGTEFTLTIEDLPAGTKTAKQMTQGGTMIVNTLKSTVETGRPSFGIRVLYGLFKVLAPLSPKRCRSENWPLDGEWPAAPKN